MMRYSEISRDLSSDSLRFVEQLGEEYIYKNLREESPPNDIPKYSGPLASRSASCNHHHQSPHQSAIYDVNNHNNSSFSCRNSTNRNNRFSCGSIGNGGGGGAGAVGCGLSTAGNLRQRKDSVKSCGGSSNIKERECDRITIVATKAINTKSSRRKNSIGSACLNAMSTSPSSGCYYCYGSTPPQGKTQSLPLNSSIKNYDEVILSALRVSAEELANQITLLDFPVFAAIQPDELTSCAWTKKDKHIVTPNIVAFTKRFNHTSFWTVQEILSGDQPKQRAEILTHFIKVAKKLYELNNLHSLFAILSAMQSASIYRLKKTWSCLTKKDKQTFDRLTDVFSDQNNWANLREYLESLRLPCIPYLGLFLTDLIYIDLAHPHSGGLEPEQRRNKMNNILRVISNYQQSDYRHILPIGGTQKYLQSIRYIEELQNIFEEDQYKKSLKLEPTSPSGPSSSSCSSKESCANVDTVGPALACLNLSPAKTIGSMRISNGAKFIPGHRKCRSLGSNIFGKITNIHNDSVAAALSSSSSSSAAAAAAQLDDRNDHSILSQPRHLLDDSVLESCQAMTDSTSTENSEVCIGGGGGGGVGLCYLEGSEGVVELMMSSDLGNCIQGCVRRKTIQKEGRKPAVASWQRYWLQIWANSLVYFPPKSFKGCERTDFKREPCKVCPLDGWSAQVIENPKHKNSFELFSQTLGTIYKFRTDSPQATYQWTNSICKLTAQRSTQRPLPPINLMSFE